jgi:cobalt-zinc-cadmium efflux system membrane fusion protein
MTDERSSRARVSRAWGIAVALLLGISASCARDPNAEQGERTREPAAHAPEAHAHDEPAGAHDESQGAHDGDGAVTLEPAAVRNARIGVGVAGPADIAVVVEAPGEVHLDAERVLEIRPRFAGVVRELRKRVGDPVAAGEVVARVQSNESLAEYDVHSDMAGTVLARPVVRGQVVTPETAMLTVADLGRVIAEFAIYPEWVGRIRAGQPVTLVAQNRGGQRAEARIHHVGPLLEQDTRISSARVVLPNSGGDWPPGLFVTARLELDRARVAVAVPDSAVVRTAAGHGVFVASGNTFRLVEVRTGRSDGRRVEIVRGLAAGDSVVVSGAFVLRSHAASAEVEHVH